MKKISASGLTVLLILVSPSIWAHGDEDHSQDGKKPTALPTASATMKVGEVPQRLADGSVWVWVPKAVQRQWRIRTELAQSGDFTATFALNGKVIADPNSGGRVQATQAGTVSPGPKGMPMPGRTVQKGEVLLYLRPTANTLERGNQQALLADLEAQLAIAKARAERLTQLEGAVPQKEIEAAKIEQEALEKRRAAVHASIHALEPLLAPVSGVVSVSNVQAGQVVEPKEILLELVDPKRLMVEALAYDTSLASMITAASGFIDSPESVANRGSPLLAFKLQFVGAGQQLREQALPLWFRIISSDHPVAVGQPVKVTVRTTPKSMAEKVKSVTVSRQALTKNSSGETVVWVHPEAERFVARKVQLQALDADRVVIIAGLQAGERVVIEGVHLLGQVR